MRGDVDSAVERLSRLQHGAWSRRQVLVAGGSGSLIDRRLRSRAWVRLDSSVYGSPAAPPTWQRSVMAAVLAEPWAVASHRSAAVLHRLDGLSTRPPGDHDPPGRQRPRPARARPPSRGHEGQQRSSRIPASPWTRSFIDLAQVTSEARLGQPSHALLTKTGTCCEQVRDRYVRARAPGWSGPAQATDRARAVRCRSTASTESELEARMRLTVHPSRRPTHRMASIVPRPCTRSAARAMA